MKKNIIILIVLILITGCSIEKIKDKQDYSKIEKFLTSGLISTSSAVGSGYPAGYVFKDDHTFSYFVGEYESIDINTLISCRGTWEIKDNNIVLTILEDEHNNNPDDIWDNIDKREQKYEVVINNARLKEVNGIEYLTTDGDNLYSLSVPDDYMEILYSLCNSYDSYYEAKNLYYITI